MEDLFGGGPAKTDDEILQKLYKERNDIALKIREREKALAKEKGLVVDSVENLTCGRHPSAKFEKETTIPKFPLALSIESEKELNVYQCHECAAEIGSPFNVFAKIAIVGRERAETLASRAYDCPKCGVVVGLFDLMNGAYVCKICGTAIGCAPLVLYSVKNEGDLSDLLRK